MEQIVTANTCYLCGKSIVSSDRRSRDHVIPKQFIERDQPKATGYDYGGFLPTHESCNKGFGGLDGASECICQKALRLISVLEGKPGIALTATKDPDTSIYCIPNTEFGDFSDREQRYFGLIDVSALEMEKWLNPDFYQNRKPMNPMERPINAALSVLAKSSSALLVKRHGIPANTYWRIAAKPCHTTLAGADLSPVLGTVKPFENGLKVWIKSFEGGHWFSVFQHRQVFVWFFFAMSDRPAELFHWNKILFDDFPALYYEGENLMGMVGYNWVKSPLG
jgi:hypothetical protein